MTKSPRRARSLAKIPPAALAIAAFIAAAQSSPSYGATAIEATGGAAAMTPGVAAERLTNFFASDALTLQDVQNLQPVLVDLMKIDLGNAADRARVKIITDVIQTAANDVVPQSDKLFKQNVDAKRDDVQALALKVKLLNEPVFRQHLTMPIARSPLSDRMKQAQARSEWYYNQLKSEEARAAIEAKMRAIARALNTARSLAEIGSEEAVVGTINGPRPSPLRPARYKQGKATPVTISGSSKKATLADMERAIQRYAGPNSYLAGDFLPIADDALTRHNLGGIKPSAWTYGEKRRIDQNFPN